MKRIRLCLYGSLTLFLCTFIVGTFFDYEINHELFHNLDTFGLVISVLGKIPGYLVFNYVGGGLFAYALRKNDYKLWLRFLFFFFSLACLLTTAIIEGLEFFGLNGFYWVTQRGWGLFISFPLMIGLSYLGYLFFRHSENKNLWILLVIIMVALAGALLGGITLIKEIFHRPRYRSVVNDALDFYPWYERCADYKEQMKLLELSSEEFKSFPSGHSGTSIGFALAALFLPFVDKKYQKIQLPLFFSGLAVAILVMFSRLYVGAHYLSDVSMGAIVSIVFMCIALEVVKNTKKFTI